MKVLITEPECYTDAQLDELRHAGLELHISNERLTQDEFDLLNEELKPEILILKLGIFFGLAHLNSNEKIKIIVTPTTGITHIEDQVSEYVKIISLKGDFEFLASITSTAEHAWFLLLDAVRNSQNLFVNSNTQTWSRSNKNKIYQLSGKTLGIIGMGRLGKILAQYGRSFRMNVVCSEQKNGLIEIDGLKLDNISISELLEKSDYVIISANYVGQKILDAKTLLSLRNPVDVLINISRGELIDEVTLLEALSSKKIGYFYTDVLTDDSSWSGSEFKHHAIYQASLSNDNIKITPHVGGYAREAIFAARGRVIKKLKIQIRNEQ